MALTFRTLGTAEVRLALRRAGPRAERLLRRALHSEGEQIMSASKPLVPVLTGALRASGQVPGTHKIPGGVAQRLGYGDDTVTYAATVHERTDIAHKNGIAKFLELPAKARIPGMATRIAAAIRVGMERGPDTRPRDSAGRFL